MILRVISKGYAADLEREFSTKSISQSYELTSPFRQRGSHQSAKIFEKRFFI